MTEMGAPGVCVVYLRACQPVLAVHVPAQANFVMQRNVKGHPQDRSPLFHNLKDPPLTHFLCVYLHLRTLLFLEPRTIKQGHLSQTQQLLDCILI